MDMTPHARGMVGIKKSAETVSIVMGNEQVENSVAIGDIPGIVCDNQGNQILPVRMTNIALMADCPFNLFSILKRLKQGWSLGGDAHAVELITPNGKNQIKFDIKISTLNAMLFAMYMKQTQDEVANVATTGGNARKQVQMNV